MAWWTSGNCSVRRRGDPGAGRRWTRRNPWSCRLECGREQRSPRAREHLGGLRRRSGRQRRPGHGSRFDLRQQRAEGLLQDHRRLDRGSGGAGHQQRGRDADHRRRVGQGLRPVPGQERQRARVLHGGLVARRRWRDRAPGHQQHRRPGRQDRGLRALHAVALPALERAEELGPDHGTAQRDLRQGRAHQGRDRAGHAVRAAEGGCRRGLGPGHERRGRQAPRREEDLRHADRQQADRRHPGGQRPVRGAQPADGGEVHRGLAGGRRVHSRATPPAPTT